MSQFSPAGGIVAEEGVLVAASEAVLQARADVSQQCDHLSREIQSLTAAWSGEGAQAFGRLHEAWQEKRHRVVSALDGLAAALEETGRDTAATDTAQADASQRLVSRLG